MLNLVLKKTLQGKILDIGGGGEGDNGPDLSGAGHSH